MTKTKILWGIKLLVGIILLILIYRSVFRHQQFMDAFRTVRWMYLLICLLLVIPNYFLQYLKWRFILRRTYKSIGKRVVIESLLFGATLGFITPGNLGELARAFYFKKYDRVTLFGLNIIDKLSGMLIFVTGGLLAINILMIIHLGWSDLMTISISVFNAFMIFILWLLALNPPSLSQLLKKIRWHSRWKERIHHTFSGLEHLSRRDAMVILSLAIIWVMVIIMQYHVLITAFGKVPILHSILAVSAALFTKVVLPVSVGDLGIREGATVYYYSLFGIPAAAAFNTSILIFFINFLLPALAGSYFVFRLNWENKKNRDNGEPASSHNRPISGS